MNRFIDAAARDILDLHELVEAWVKGAPGAPPVDMEKFLSHFHPEFVMIAPAGRRQGREALAKAVIDAIDGHDELDIDIVDLDLVLATDDVAVFTYEEQRHTPHQFKRRISTATFVRDGEGKPLLKHLQETWIEE
ncbi:MAG: nuclear transport factor 2 family protein [Paludibacterium sp.]|uniref:nuclear transport factor 2 family protein n=1 Tax=Paludibacterium sp. TaxID=1917523 RepID=UPI0025D478EB|nr:nuclear transport factor 2 family protein [Paludibacterium sp.]MBV8047986.1 nuclear transport factor 2 family protein [Paludibacterium sp.]MBV8649154.1 nuclear transport factor 2 family protein [Paludibacterium sp.]